jgi:sorbitol/mannitol transport system permease protein
MYLHPTVVITMNTSTAKAHLETATQRKTAGQPRLVSGQPSVALLLLWMIVPLGMTLYFSLIRYNLLDPG